MQASTCCIPRNQEHIFYRSPVIANFLLKFSNLCYHGNRGWSETNFAYTVKFTDPENPLIGARIRNIYPIEAQLGPIANFLGFRSWQTPKFGISH